MRKHVAYLSSDRLEGRFSGSRGARKAASFIAGLLGDYGLTPLAGTSPLYWQHFTMHKKRLVESSISSRYGRIDNWTGFGERFSDFYGESDTEIVFAGYGRDQEIEKLNLEGRIAAFFTGEPGNHEGEEALEQRKIRSIRNHGALGHMMVYHDEQAAARYTVFRKAFYNDYRYYLDLPRDRAVQAERAITVLPSALAGLFGIRTETLLETVREMDRGEEAAGRFHVPIRMKTVYTNAESVAGANVAGYFPGRGGTGKWIVLSAHYDHLGTHRGRVYNGADDNASGVAALLEIAESLSSAVKAGWEPRHNILFLFTDAEEIGANGSRYFLVSGVIPRDDMIIDVNVDAIGRTDASHSALRNYVYLYRSSGMPAALSSAITSTIQTQGDAVNSIAAQEPPGSDNFVFEMSGIPAAAFTTGRSSDYHQPSDTADKCDYPNIQRISAFVYALVWNLAESVL
ncbi:M20/M25/M40 family metallo-hydrolase [bacterium]|nr:M20/M25/M40 family metallo-hydrolase [bacterium]